MHTLICVTFSLLPGVRGCLRLLLVALPGIFYFPFCKCGCLDIFFTYSDYACTAVVLREILCIALDTLDEHTGKLLFADTAPAFTDGS